jgi:hypothetical protein
MKFKQAQDTILDFFSESKVRKTKSVWEKIEGSDEWKWILVLHNLNWGDAIILHTKFILKTTADKSELSSQQFGYLYDINCKYRYVDFKNQDDLFAKLKKIIFGNLFGPNIKNLSKFMRNPTISLNDYFAKHNITDWTIFDLDYQPKITIVPCSVISFDFKFDINNLYTVELNIKKEGKSKYIYTFKLDNKLKTVETDDLSNIEGVIATYIQNIVN